MFSPLLETCVYVGWGGGGGVEWNGVGGGGVERGGTMCRLYFFIKFIHST